MNGLSASLTTIISSFLPTTGDEVDFWQPGGRRPGPQAEAWRAFLWFSEGEEADQEINSNE
jgi:hypothetical protein